MLSSSEEGMKGVEELNFICDNVADLGLSTAILDLGCYFGTRFKLLYGSYF